MPASGSTLAYLCAKSLKAMNSTIVSNISNTCSVTSQSPHPAPDELSIILQESGFLKNEQLYAIDILTPLGTLSIKKSFRSGYEISFPDNRYNLYKLRYSKEPGWKIADWVHKEWGHLCWGDFHYSQPPDYNGDSPDNLDELCVYYKKRRAEGPISGIERKKIAGMFLDMIFDEAYQLSRKLELPFQRLHLYSSDRLSTVASTDCFGKISYNAFYLFDDADSIRQTLVHELCHSLEYGHGKKFSKILEESMLALGFISRPCAYSDKFYDPFEQGAHFPSGKYCPGYDFYVRSNMFPFIVSVIKNPELNPMRGISLWKNV